MEVTVQYQDQKKKLNLLVVTGGGTSLAGRDWLRHLRLNWCELNQLRSAARLKLEDVLKNHADVFKEELGKSNRDGSEDSHGSGCTASVFPSSSSTSGVETESGEGTGEIGSRQGHRTSSVF